MPSEPDAFPLRLPSMPSAATLDTRKPSSDAALPTTSLMTVFMIGSLLPATSVLINAAPNAADVDAFSCCDPAGNGNSYEAPLDAMPTTPALTPATSSPLKIGVAISPPVSYGAV